MESPDEVSLGITEQEPEMEDNMFVPGERLMGWADGAPSLMKNLKVDPARDHYPLCIVWWLCPPIGHLGIVTSEGVIHDFAGPYHVNKHHQSTIFGRPTRYYRVNFERPGSEGGYDIERIRDWDAEVERSSADFEKKMHNLLWNNCHSHVAQVLNRIRFKRITAWNTFLLILFMFFFGKFTSWPRFWKTYLPFLVLVALAIFVLVLTRGLG